jgi:hypothetical protein
MKMLLGFFIGMTVCLLLVLTIGHNTALVSADDNTALPDGTDISGLMPDVGKIYRVALGEPYRQVESEITDPDIARYFRHFMDRTGLDKIGLE